MTERYYLDQTDYGVYIIKSENERYYAGRNKEKARNLIQRLNLSHRPSIEFSGNSLYVCWGNHEKGEKCEYELEISECV